MKKMMMMGFGVAAAIGWMGLSRAADSEDYSNTRFIDARDCAEDYSGIVSLDTATALGHALHYEMNGGVAGNGRRRREYAIVKAFLNGVLAMAFRKLFNGAGPCIPGERNRPPAIERLPEVIDWINSRSYAVRPFARPFGRASAGLPWSGNFWQGFAFILQEVFP